MFDVSAFSAHRRYAAWTGRRFAKHLHFLKCFEHWQKYDLTPFTLYMTPERELEEKYNLFSLIYW